MKRCRLLLPLAAILSMAGLSAQHPSLSTLIPTVAELAGFQITEAAQYYDAGNLWDYIDGGAPGYLAYGFKQAAAFTVVHSADQLEFVVDIYDMGDALNAFGIYSSERAPDGTAANAGSEGYRTENALFFWQDRYYVKIVGYAAAPTMAATSSKLAAILSRKLPPRGAPPKLFSAFPQEGRVPRSERFLARDVLGQRFLRNGYIVEYTKKDGKYRVFLIRGANAAEARQNFQQYRKFVESNGAISARPRIGEEAFAGRAGAYGALLVARQGRYMLGVLGLDDPDAARAIIVSLFSTLDRERD
jgi:hypothetical protein